MRFIYCTWILLVLLHAAPALGQGWSWQGSRQQPDKLQKLWEVTPARDTAGWTGTLFDFYQSEVSSRQGSRCPCFPSCSRFTELAIQEYGLFTGIIMGFERLYLREHTGLIRGLNYHRVKLQHETKIYDLPEANCIFSGADWRILAPDHFADYLYRRRAIHHHE